MTRLNALVAIVGAAVLGIGLLEAGIAVALTGGILPALGLTLIALARRACGSDADRD